MEDALLSSDLAAFSPDFLDATSSFIFLIGLKLAASDGLSVAGLGLRDPKKADGLAARDTDAVRWTEDGLDGAFDEVEGLKD